MGVDARNVLELVSSGIWSNFNEPSHSMQGRAIGALQYLGRSALGVLIAAPPVYCGPYIEGA